MIIFSILLNFLLNMYIEKRTDIKIEEGIPMISYVLVGIKDGSNGRPAGWYNSSAKLNYYYSNLDKVQAGENAYEAIRIRLSELSNNPSNFCMFFLEKIVSTWCEPTYQSIWINEPLEKYELVHEKIENDNFLMSLYSNTGRLNMIHIKYLDALQIIIYIISAIYFIKNRNSLNIKSSILAVIFLGGVLFHLAWETKSLYILMYVELLFPYVAEQISKFVIREK